MKGLKLGDLGIGASMDLGSIGIATPGTNCCLGNNLADLGQMTWNPTAEAIEKEVNALPPCVVTCMLNPANSVNTH